MLLRDFKTQNGLSSGFSGFRVGFPKTTFVKKIVVFPTMSESMENNINKVLVLLRGVKVLEFCTQGMLESVGKVRQMTVSNGREGS
jgi:hypothetical protein